MLSRSAFLCLTIVAGFSFSAPILFANLSQVAPVDLSSLQPDAFKDVELDRPWHAGSAHSMPYLLNHFHRLANAVVEEGPNKGFIDLHVWRRPRDNEPYNARIMENITSLAYFYATDRPWNPYYRDPALRERLEAALDFWLSIQNEDGRFSEYGPNRWSVAPTAFAVKFMAETLELLETGVPLREGLIDKIWEAQRRAIFITMTDESMFRHGTRFSNQFGNLWGGTLMYLKRFDDPELKAAMRTRLEQGKTAFQSPAGFYYELHGPDWVYAFGTHNSNLTHAWEYSEGTEWQDFFVEEKSRWTEWLSYNAYPEPGYRIFTLNRATQFRLNAAFLVRLESPLAKAIPLLRAFSPSEDEATARLNAIRKDLEANWPEVPELEVGAFSAFSPYSFLHLRTPQFFPSAETIAEARELLPFRKRERFTHQRVDSRNPLIYTYIQRPGYYAIFNSGAVLRETVRMGLALLAHPETGTFLQSQDRSDRWFWGTRPNRPGEVAYEAATLDAAFLSRDGSEEFLAAPGVRDLSDDFGLIQYNLGEAGQKLIHFMEDRVGVEVQHEGGFVEQIPLFVMGDPVMGENWIEFTLFGHKLTIVFEGALEMELSAPQDSPGRIFGTDRHVPDVGLNNRDYLLQGKETRLLEIKGEDSLRYEIRIMPKDTD